MDDIRSLTYRLEDAVLNDPTSCCCVPYQQNLPVLRRCPQPSKKLPLPPTGERIMGQQYVNLELYPGPSRPVPHLKAELRGGKHFPACSCVKRNGLQDSCLSWRCMLPLNKDCAALPFPACGLGRRQLAVYSALPDRTPEYCKQDQPPC